MPISVAEFTENLSRSKLMTTEDAAAMLREVFGDSLPDDANSVDANSVAAQLVDASKLTPFQSSMLLDNLPQPIVMDEYVLLELLGEGGMGQVFTALHQRMDRVVALKVLHSSADPTSAANERFMREVRVAGKLTHENIVTAYDAGNCDGINYLVMEYVEGKDLAEVIKSGAVEMRLALDYVVQAARGLEFAHGRGIVHRDIKPQNLILDKSGTVRILDMGIARLDEEDAVDRTAATQAMLTGQGVIMGTVDFMAPEQAANASEADQRSDIYSLGCVLFNLLTGREVYTGDTVVAKLFAHKGDAVPSVSALREEIPLVMDSVIQKMIAKKPADRYQSMNEVLGALQTFLQIAHGEAGRVDSGPEPAPAPDTKQTSPSDTALSEMKQLAFESLHRFINSRGISDKFIDFDEEQEIFRKGGDLELTVDEVNEVLRHKCSDQGWFRQKTIIEEVATTLEAAVSDGGLIEKQQFDEAVAHAVRQKMPRKAAIESCLELMLNNAWEANQDDDSWFQKRLERAGLD